MHLNASPSTRTPLRTARAGVIVALLTAAVVAACSSPTAVQSSTKVSEDTLLVFAISGTPLGFPAALNTLPREVVRIDPSWSFDIAFDIDSAGNAVIIPVRLVGGSATRAVPTTFETGLKKLTTAFDAATKAPTSGYEYDSVMTVKPGEAFFIQAHRVECATFVNQFVYSRLAIDSVVSVKRAIYFRFVVDANCGYLTLIPGVLPTK